MDRLVDKLEEYPLSNKDLLKSLNNKTKVLKYEDLKKYNDINNIFYPYNNFILLYQKSKTSGHWVCLIKRRNEIEFFDPYGVFPDEQFKYLQYKQPLYLTKLLLNSNCKIVYNNKKFQEKDKNVNTCGRHILLRLVASHLNLDEYKKLFQNQKLDSDEIVTMMTSYL